MQPSPYSNDYGIYADPVSTSGLVHYYTNPNGSSYDYNQYSQNPYSSHFPSNVNHTSSHPTEIFNNVQSLDINSSNGKTNHHFTCNLMESTTTPPPVPVPNNSNMDHVRVKIKEEIASSKLTALHHPTKRISNSPSIEFHRRTKQSSGNIVKMWATKAREDEN